MPVDLNLLTTRKPILDGLVNLRIYTTQTEKAVWLMQRYSKLFGDIGVDYHGAMYCYCRAGTVDMDFNLNGAGPESHAAKLQSYWENKTNDLSRDVDLFLSLLPGEVIGEWFNAIDAIQAVAEASDDRDGTEGEVERSDDSDS